MQVAENHHPGRGRSRRLLRALAGPAVVLLITVGFFWKLVLTDQYTWMESPDTANMILPWIQYQAGEWHQGRFPLWAPYHWGGQPLVGQAQPGAVYPPNWLLFLAPLKNGWVRQASLHWYFVLVHCMGAVFCYWLCRDLKCSAPASVVAASVFALGGFLGTVGWVYMLNGAVWAPLVFMFLLRALGGRRPVANAALSGLFLGASWLSGHHQIPLFISLAAAGVWIYYFFRRGRPDWGLLRIALVWAAFTGLVSAAQTLPAWEYGRLAVRWINLEEPVAWNQPVPYIVHRNYAISPYALLGLVLPGVYRNTDPFVGITAISLGLLGIAMAWRKLMVRLFAAVGLGGLLFALAPHNPFHGVLYALVPLVEKARAPAMAILIFDFSLAILIAYGIDELTSSEISSWPRRAAWILGVVGGAVYVALALLFETGKYSTGSDDRVALSALIALLAAGVLYGCSRRQIGKGATAALLGLLVLVELNNHSGPNYYPSRFEPQHNRYLKPLSQFSDIATFLRSEPWPVRTEIDDKVIPFNFGDWYGIDVYGGFFASLPQNFLRLEFPSPRAKMLFGVNYSVGKQPAQPGQREVFQGADGVKVFMNATVNPRVWAVHEAVEARDDAHVRQFMQDPTFDLHRRTFLFGKPPILDSCAGADRVRLVSRTPNRLTIEAEMKCRGMVVVGDSYFPGWKAKVDGRGQPVIEAYTALRGVVVDAGRHRIELVYRPWTVYLGAILSFAGIAGACVIAWRARRAPDVASGAESEV